MVNSVKLKLRESADLLQTVTKCLKCSTICGIYFEMTLYERQITRMHLMHESDTVGSGDACLKRVCLSLVFDQTGGKLVWVPLWGWQSQITAHFERVARLLLDSTGLNPIPSDAAIYSPLNLHNSRVEAAKKTHQGGLVLFFDLIRWRRKDWDLGGSRRWKGK